VMRSTVINRIDHLVYASPDLVQGVDELEQRLGVLAKPGGRHPAWGTRNSLIALGERIYLEVIAPDPDQIAPERARPFGIDDLDSPRLASWAAREADLEHIVTTARNLGIDLGAIYPGNRQTADGTVLSWKLTDPLTTRYDGLLPFFIDWGTTPHPAPTAAPGCALIELRAEHPDADRLRAVLTALDLDLTVTAGESPSLIATISSPRGVVELR